MYFPMPFTKMRLSEKFRRPQKKSGTENANKSAVRLPADLRVFGLV